MAAQRRFELDGVPADVLKVKLASTGLLCAGDPPAYEDEGYVIARVRATAAGHTTDTEGREVRTVTLSATEAYHVDAATLDLGDVLDRARAIDEARRGVVRLDLRDAAGVYDSAAADDAGEPR